MSEVSNDGAGDDGAGAFFVLLLFFGPCV